MERPKSINEEDWNSLRYFWLEKGDLSRWCDWKEAKSRLQTSLEGRMILIAWNEKCRAERELTLLLSN